MPSSFEVVVMGGTVDTAMDVVEWAKRCEAFGAGELLPTSMDRDGTQTGYDLEFTRKISEAVNVPVIASGGAGSLEDLYEGVVKGGATILLVASLFHFRTISIRQAKKYLRAKGLTVTI
jgi:cyclase